MVENNIAKLEQILKSYSKGILGLESSNYWDRLRILKINSIQRQMEHYRMLYIWKVITGKVPNFGLSWDSNSRRGRMVSIRSYKVSTPTQAKNLIDQSLGVHGGCLFNLLPFEIRNFEGTTDKFETQLDNILKNVPDKPLCDGLYPDPV